MSDPTSSRPWSTRPGKTANALEAVNSGHPSFPSRAHRNARPASVTAGSGLEPRARNCLGRQGPAIASWLGVLSAVRSAHGRICRGLRFVATTVEHKHCYLHIGTLVARAHECGHFAAAQTFDRVGKPAFHRVVERLPCGSHIEPLTVLEQGVLEAAVPPAHQNDDEVVINVCAALRRPSIAVLLGELHERGRNLLRELPPGARRLIGFD